MRQHFNTCQVRKLKNQPVRVRWSELPQYNELHANCCKSGILELNKLAASGREALRAWNSQFPCGDNKQLVNTNRTNGTKSIESIRRVVDNVRLALMVILNLA